MNLIQQDKFENILEKFKTLAPILVVGDLGLDKYTSGEVKRISPEAPVPILEVTQEWEKLGLAANVSDNLKSFGVDSTLAGVVGNDAKANRLEELLEEKHLKTWGLIRDQSRTTTFKERVTTQAQQICRIDYESKEPINEETKKRLKTRIQEFAQSHQSVIIEDYGKGLLSEEICQFIIQAFHSVGKIVTVDPSRSSSPHWYRGCDLLKPNRVEAELMLQQLGVRNVKQPEEMSLALAEKLEIKRVLITLGAQGMCMLDSTLDGRPHVIPTVANEVFDVSGAGDTVIAIVTAALASGANLEQAAWLGNCAAGVVVRKRGTALCSISELKAFYQNLRSNLS
jgi:rfaE bifunctional protein kinase chain/domain